MNLIITILIFIIIITIAFIYISSMVYIVGYLLGFTDKNKLQSIMMINWLLILGVAMVVFVLERVN